MSQREEYNGRVNVRMDPELHRLLGEVAGRLPDLSVPGLVRLLLESGRPMLESMRDALIAAENGDVQAAATSMRYIRELASAQLEEMQHKTAPDMAEIEELAHAGQQ